MKKTAKRSYKTEINRDNVRALESVVNSLLAEKEAEIGRLTAERDRYKAVLEVIAGNTSDKLHAMQAKAALTNIGANVTAMSPADRS